MVMRILFGVTIVVWLLVLAACWRVLTGRGLLAKVQGLITTLLFGSVGVLLAAGLVVLHAFQAFSGETLVGTVTTRPLAAEEFELTYPPIGSPPQAPTTVRLRGDQWAISGGIIKWQPWLTAAGMRSYHRPMRVAGQFSQLARQRAEPPTVESLDPAGVDWFWEVLARVDPAIPLIEAVYGSCAYVYVAPHQMHDLYVTPSGYMIKRAR